MDSTTGEVRDSGPLAVSCENLAFSYPGTERPALSNVSFEVRAGEYVGVVGPNGGGKSTLARMLNGLLAPDSGSSRVLGVDPAVEPFEARKKVGVLFQNPENSLVAPFVEDDVAFGLENRGAPVEEMRVRVRSALRAVGLEGYEKRETHTLSGGEKQCLALAGLLAVEPEVLVLDEPTSMLDPPGKRGLLRILDGLRGNKTVLHVTHHLEELLWADRILVLNEGQVMSEVVPSVLFSDARLLGENGLVLPPVLRLARDLGLDLPEIDSSEELAQAILKEMGKRVIR
ncbi:MAG: ATP-binding cassette domain-containing protein [Rubrobacteraceae bacterium]